MGYYVIVVVTLWDDFFQFPGGHGFVDHVINYLSHNQKQIGVQGASLPNPPSDIKVLWGLTINIDYRLNNLKEYCS